MSNNNWRMMKPKVEFVVEVRWHATKKRLRVMALNGSKALISAAHACRGGLLHPVEYVVENVQGTILMRATPEEVDVLKGRHQRAERLIAQPLIGYKHTGAHMGGVRA